MKRCTSFFVRDSDCDIDKSLGEFKGDMACDIDWSFPLYQDGSLMLLNSKPIDILQAFDGIFYHP
jgi:hypothetical protein